MKGLVEGNWVVPSSTHLGTWRNLAVCKEADLLKLPEDTLPIEHAAVFRELCLAYRLLEDHGNLKVHQHALRSLQPLEFLGTNRTVQMLGSSRAVQVCHASGQIIV